MKKETLLLNAKIIIMMICAIVGVGFISGAEIYQFFARFEKFAFLSIVIFFALMFWLTYKIIWKDNNYQNNLKLNKFNKNISKNTFLYKFKIKSFLTNLNLLFVSSAMFAGLFSLIKNLFNHNYYFIEIIVIIFVFLVLLSGAKGLQKFDYLVICFVGFIFFYFLAKMIFNFPNFNFEVINLNSSNLVKSCFGSMLFACLYVFMNVVQIQPIVHEFDGKLNSKHKWLIPFIFSFLISILLSIFVLFMFKIFNLNTQEMPFFYYFKSQDRLSYFVYVVGLIFALLSSLLSCLIGVKKWVGVLSKSNFLTTSLSILFSMVFSLIGFSNFVSIIYPIIGFINFIVFVFL